MLLWGYPPAGADGRRPNVGEFGLWDPSKGTRRRAVKVVEPDSIDPDGDGAQPEVSPPLFCSGQSHLANGALLATGGTLAAPNTSSDDPYEDWAGLETVYTFDPFAEEWIRQPNMAGGRWYPSQVLLGDGRTAILAGYTEEPPGGVYSQMAEIFEPPADPGGVGKVRQVGAGPEWQTDNYPRLFTLPSGDVLLSGPAARDHGILSFPDGGEADRRTIAPPPDDRKRRIGSTAVLRPDGPRGSWRVTEIGGFDPSRPAPGGGRNFPATETAVTLDARTGSWSTDASLRRRRSYHNTVLLPDGSMVAVGGADGYTEEERRYAARPVDKRVEIWKPGRGGWRLGPSQREYRSYHSTALLLPDGRVWSAGDDRHPLEPTASGGLRGSTVDTAEIYKPPYLFNKGRRPRIVRAPRRLGYRDVFGIRTRRGSGAKAVLVAPGAVTHAVDMSQRVVPLKRRRKVPGTGLNAVSPPNPNVAPPGYYMLFVLRGNGKPSRAEWVQLDPTAGNAAKLRRKRGHRGRR